MFYFSTLPRKSPNVEISIFFYFDPLTQAESALRQLNSEPFDVAKEIKEISQGLNKCTENNNNNDVRQKTEVLKNIPKYPDIYKPFLIITVLRKKTRTYLVLSYLLISIYNIQSSTLIPNPIDATYHHIQCYTAVQWGDCHTRICRQDIRNYFPQRGSQACLREGFI